MIVFKIKELDVFKFLNYNEICTKVKYTHSNSKIKKTNFTHCQTKLHKKPNIKKLLKMRDTKRLICPHWKVHSHFKCRPLVSGRQNLGMLWWCLCQKKTPQLETYHKKCTGQNLNAAQTFIQKSYDDIIYFIYV